MANIDFGKQMGPLPLGAWIVVVAGGLGIAWYTRKTPAPVVVEDTTGTPGVGTGAVGGWTQTTPQTDAVTSPTITTNDEWARAAINYLLAQGYPANVSDSAIRKYLVNAKLSTQEYALLGIALLHFGAPPTPLPPEEDDSTPPESDSTVGAPNVQINSVNGDWVYLSWSSVPSATMYEVTASGAKNSGSAGHLFNSYGWWAGKGSGLVTFTVRAKVGDQWGPASSPVSTQV